MPLELGFGKQVHLSEDPNKSAWVYFPLMPTAGGMVQLCCIMMQGGMLCLLGTAAQSTVPALNSTVSKENR